MSEFLAFYKNGVYKFCIKTDDSKSLGLQRNLIYKDEGIGVTDEIRRCGYMDSINRFCRDWSVKEYV